MLETIFRHPAPGNLAWSDALHLIERLGTATPEPNGKLMLTIGEHKQVIHQPHGKELTPEELALLRKFLESAGATPSSVEVAEEGAPAERAALDILVTMDHHEARLFAIVGTSVGTKRLRPHDPHHFLHHLTHRQERELRGQRQTEEPRYYEEIASALSGAQRILLFGRGEGHSNAAVHLEEVLRNRHPDLARRVIATKAVDLSAMTEAQLLAAAAQMLDAAGGSLPAAR